MAEEITYIPYGLDEISQLELLTALANDLPDFMNKYKWLLKPKNRDTFLKIYSDMVNGLTGASNDSGLWSINTSNDMNSYLTSPREKEIAEHAAYYIQLQMAKITPRKKEEEKEDVKPFNFVKDFNKSLLNYYGGNSELFKDPEQGWDAQDARGADGLRGIDKRRGKMIEALKNYKDSLTGKNYNFEGTSFKDLNDAQTKIQAAIDALGTVDNTTDDLEAFNALGLPYRAYFSNGGNDPYTKGDYTGTYSGYNEYLAEQNKVKQKAEQEKLKLQRANQYNGYKYYDLSKFNGRPLTVLESTIEHLNNIIAKEKWTGDEASQIRYAFKLAEKNGALEVLSKEEQALFSPMWKNRTRHLRKIKGINGLYYDTISGKYLKPYKNGQTSQISFLDILNLNSPEAVAKRKLEAEQKVLNNYLNSTEGGFTPAELREVAALLFDLGAAVDPEGISSAGLSLVASAFRDYNRATDPEGWTWGDTGWATLDHGLGLLSLIPVAGGWVKGAWAASKLGKYIPKMEKAIRLAGRAGSTYAMADNAPGALNTLNKIKNGEDLSLKDYQDLAYFFIGGLGHHQLNRGNRVERTAMKARGIETSNSILNKAGITRTKAKVSTTETTPTLKIKKTGEDGKVETKEIPIKEEHQEILRGTKPLELDAKAKSLGIEIPEGYKIDLPTTTWSKSKINEYKSKAGYGNKEIFGTLSLQKQTPPVKSNEEFEQYLSEHNNTWLKKFFNGSNKDIRRYDKYYLNNRTSNTSENNVTETESSKNTPTEVSKEKVKSIREDKNFQLYRDILDYKKKDTSRGVLKDGSESSLEFKGKSYNFKYDGKSHSVIINGKSIKVDPEKGMEGIRKEVVKFIEQQRKSIIKPTKLSKEELKELIEKLKELKKQGFLKHGGKVEPSLDTIIEDFIKNNNI